MFTRIEALFIGLFLDLATFLIASKSTRIVHLKLALALVQSNVAYFSPRKRRLSKEKEPLSQQHNNAKKKFANEKSAIFSISNKLFLQILFDGFCAYMSLFNLKTRAKRKFSFVSRFRFMFYCAICKKYLSSKVLSKTTF